MKESSGCVRCLFLERTFLMSEETNACISLANLAGNTDMWKNYPKPALLITREAKQQQATELLIHINGLVFLARPLQCTRFPKYTGKNLFLYSFWAVQQKFLILHCAIKLWAEFIPDWLHTASSMWFTDTFVLLLLFAFHNDTMKFLNSGSQPFTTQMIFRRQIWNTLDCKWGKEPVSHHGELLEGISAIAILDHPSGPSRLLFHLTIASSRCFRGRCEIPIMGNYAVPAQRGSFFLTPGSQWLACVPRTTPVKKVRKRKFIWS